MNVGSRPHTHPRPSLPRRCLIPVICAGALLFSGCSGGGSNSGPSDLSQPSQGVYLQSIEHGKLADVYGLRTENGAQVISLYETDVLLGIDIRDERDASSTKADSEVLYDFINANPDNLQPRLLITREIDSDEFKEAFAALDRNVRRISPTQFGQNNNQSPYSVVPRNSALRLIFSGNLGVTDDDLYVRDANGKISGYKNSEAIQLLKITGDPNDTKYENDFQVIDSRIRIRDNRILIDPVLLGSEGLIFGARNSASGMPESADQFGANIRVAVALDGPLRIPSVGKDRTGTVSGRNNQGYVSIVRDFRSGNRKDDSPDISRGFIRDSQPPRIIGEMLMYLDRVEDAGVQSKIVTVFKNDINHEIDRGDLMRFFVDESGIPIASLEVLRDPTDDQGLPDVQRVRVQVRPVLGPNGEDVLESIDPSNNPDYPVNAGEARNDFLRAHAPRIVLVSEFTHRRRNPDPNGDPFYGDDPRYFLSFNPTPLPSGTGAVTIPNENVSPFAGAIVRFSKPIDMDSLLALDTAFFATRNVLDREAIAAFIQERRILESTFNEDKFRTPHLISSRIFDEDKSQTAIRVRPTLGFYLDDAMRDAAEEDKNLPFAERRYHYFLHLVGGLNGISDLSGNPLDLQSEPAEGMEVAESVVMEFSIDTRDQPNGQQRRFENNYAVYVTRRFAADDEDERPNYYLDGEITPLTGETPAAAYKSADFFGPISYLPDGTIVPRTGSRVTKIVDDVNQLPAPPQSSTLRWCPSQVSNQDSVIFQTAATAFGQPIQNPLNPYGCRLQTCWREIDMSLSRTDPLDFNLDVEQLYWAPFRGNPIYFDEFDQVSLFLGHSEFRPEPCISTGSAFPSMQQSGLFNLFTGNYVHNLNAPATIGYKPLPHPAYVDKVLVINSKDAILDPSLTNRFLPLPNFEDATKTANKKNPYFVWRDEQERGRGGISNIAGSAMNPYPYLLSPFLSGLGSRVVGAPGNITFANGGWYNGTNVSLSTGQFNDQVTHGLVGPIALPLLADFWTYPDSAEKPKEDPYVASGVNGWQISIPVTSARFPFFRAYSSGGGPSKIQVGPSHKNWEISSGGFAVNGSSTTDRDNSVYWIMADFLKRTSVVTGGFVEIFNPHRMPMEGGKPKFDPRLGPYDTVAGGMLPTFAFDFEPALSDLPAGTSVVPEFSAASVLDTPSAYWPITGSNKTDATNFPLDPLKAGDAWVQHWDDRGGRNWWTYMYNRTVTEYIGDPNEMMSSSFLRPFGGPGEAFDAKNVKYFNWRFIMKNNVDSSPAVSPRLESFSISYRFNPN